MKLFIGGCAQGKLRYVMQKYGLKEDAVWDGVLPDEEEKRTGAVVINHFHRWVKKCLQNRECPEEQIRLFVDRCEDCIIICDEIGNGIVPMEAFEREYRERTGRILVQLAGEAKEVERIICGIGQKIK